MKIFSLHMLALAAIVLVCACATERPAGNAGTSHSASGDSPMSYRMSWSFEVKASDIVYLLDGKKMGAGIAGLNRILDVLEVAPLRSVLTISFPFVVASGSSEEKGEVLPFETVEALRMRFLEIKSRRYLEVRRTY